MSMENSRQLNDILSPTKDMSTRDEHCHTFILLKDGRKRDKTDRTRIFLRYSVFVDDRKTFQSNSDLVCLQVVVPIHGLSSLS